jgi:myo-inositol 2-dehydrogenase/D-chiro-inositol 1-dehydrogenase
MNDQSTTGASRRDFLKTSGAALAGAAFAAPLILGTRASAAPGDVIRVGLIGCGGRGGGAAKNALQADPNTQLVAIGDAFQDRLNSSLANLRGDREVGKRVNVDAANTFVGLDCYKGVLESNVDVVLLATPPGFRPMHFAAAVKAGKHCFVEKPVATDPTGVRAMIAAQAEAAEKKLAVSSGYCWRYSKPEQAGFEKVLDGTIGDVTSLYGTYLTGSLWDKPRQEGWSDAEWQLRNWLYFTWLSGDHLVEQAIHAVDWMQWAMKDEAPVNALAVGGRQVRVEPKFGNIYDHFGVTYEYKSGARGFIFCRQQANCANDNSITVYGTKGYARILGFGGSPFVKDYAGKTLWRYGGGKNDMYEEEHVVLFKSIRDGKPINDGPRMNTSTMTGILGRMVGYTGGKLTYDEALNAQEDLFPKDLTLKSELPVPPVPRPGITKIA